MQQVEKQRADGLHDGGACGVDTAPPANAAPRPAPSFSVYAIYVGQALPAAVEVTPTEENLRRIDEVAPKGVAAGERYNEAGMRTVNR